MLLPDENASKTSSPHAKQFEKLTTHFYDVCHKLSIKLEDTPLSIPTRKDIMALILVLCRNELAFAMAEKPHGKDRRKKYEQKKYKQWDLAGQTIDDYSKDINRALKDPFHESLQEPEKIFLEMIKHSERSGMLHAFLRSSVQGIKIGAALDTCDSKNDNENQDIKRFKESYKAYQAQITTMNKTIADKHITSWRQDTLKSVYYQLKEKLAVLLAAADGLKQHNPRLFEAADSFKQEARNLFPQAFLQPEPKSVSAAGNGDHAYRIKKPRTAKPLFHIRKSSVPTPSGPAKKEIDSAGPLVERQPYPLPATLDDAIKWLDGHLKKPGALLLCDAVRGLCEYLDVSPDNPNAALHREIGNHILSNASLYLTLEVLQPGWGMSHVGHIGNRIQTGESQRTCADFLREHPEAMSILAKATEAHPGVPMLISAALQRSPKDVESDITSIIREQREWGNDISDIASAAVMKKPSELLITLEQRLHGQGLPPVA